MPNVAELGQKVKAKYPGSYDTLSDIEVGQKVKAKYPGAYDQFTDGGQAAPQQKGFLRSLINGPETMIRGVKGAVDVLRQGGQAQSSFNKVQQTEGLIKQALALPKGDPRRRQLLEQAKGTSQQAGQIAGNSLNALNASPSALQTGAATAETLATVGLFGNPAALSAKTIVGQGAKQFAQSAGKKAAINAGVGFGFGTAGGLAEGKGLGDSLKQGGVSAALMGGISGAGSLAKLGIAGIGASSKLSNKVAQSAGKVGKLKNPDRMNKVTDLLTKELKVSATTKGYVKQLSTLSDDLNKQSTNIVSKSTKINNSRTVLGQIKKALHEQFPQNKATVDKVFKSLSMDDLRNSKGVNDKILNQIRQEIGKQSKYKSNSDADILKGARAAYDVIRKNLVKGNKGLDKVLDKHSTALDAFNALNGNKPSFITDALGGIAGGSILGGPVGGLSGIAGTIAFKSPANRVNLARALTKIGVGPQFIDKASDSQLLQLFQLATKLGLIKATSD